MRALAAPSAVVLLLAIHSALVAQEFPYTVVAADRAPLRAGASETNEPTTYLRGGTKLEVYSQQGNFLAVRPPKGSFSWVRASEVEPTGDAEVVRVVAAAAQAWVGHQGTDLRAVSQVQLQPGEKLRVLGAVASPQNPTQAAWYQIAPPAGEFRFVLAQHVAADAPAPTAPPSTNVAPVQLTSWSTQPESAAAALPAAAAQLASAAALPTTSIDSQYLQSALGIHMNAMPLAASDPVAQRLKQIDAELAAMIAQPPSTWNTTSLYSELQTLSSTAPTAELRTQAQNLWWRVAKCQQVQEGYAQISAGQIAAATQLPRVPQATTVAATAPANMPVAQATPAAFAAPQNPASIPQPVAQTELQPLISRIKELAGTLNANMQQQQTYSSTLRNRSAATSSLAAAADEPTSSVLASAVTEEPSGDAAAEAGGYAGTGWLMPLVNRSQLSRDTRSGVPPFALTDDDGNVKFLVTPTPGLSVSQYARKKVGIIGPAGRLEGLSNPHITAQRVVVLERHE